MDTALTARPPSWLRGFVSLVLLGACAGLLTGGFRAPQDQLHTVFLLLVALSVYLWVLAPTVASGALTALVAACLIWISAARHLPLLGWQLAALVVLMGAAMWQTRRRFARLQRLQQALDDAREERTVKDQAIHLAAQTRDALQKKLARYTQLQTIAEELSNLTDLTAIAKLAVTRAFSLIGKSDVCLLFLVNAERQELSLFASKRREGAPPIRAKHGDQFDRHVLRSHRPLLVNDARRDFRFTVTAGGEREVSSVIACPLLLGQTPSGVLRLDTAQPAAFTQDDLRFLDILLDLVATAATNARLFARTQQLAVTDGLTGLTLRRPFLEQLGRELSRAARSREPASVLLLDVDHFKAYNDAHGHMAGDVVLKHVADILRTVVPPDGVIGRYGGEEFVVLLPRLPRAAAADVAEKIRRVIEAQVVHGGRGGTGGQPVTASLGVAAFPDDGQAELELIRAADQRLYQAKRNGRNQVCGG